MSTAWNRTTKYLVGVGLVLFGLYVLYLSGPVLPMLVIAALVSFYSGRIQCIDSFDRQIIHIPMRGLPGFGEFFIYFQFFPVPFHTQ